MILRNNSASSLSCTFRDDDLCSGRKHRPSTLMKAEGTGNTPSTLKDVVMIMTCARSQKMTLLLLMGTHNFH